MLEKIIEKYILENHHCCSLTVEPQKTIPKLHISDIQNEANIVKYEEIKKDIILVESESDITYVKLMFKTDVVSEDKLQYVGILIYLLGKLETEKLGQDELLREIDYYIGRFDVFFCCYAKSDDIFSPVIDITIRVLKSNLEKALNIVENIINYTKFGDASKIKHLLKNLSSSYKKSFVTNGDKYAISRAKSYVSAASNYDQRVQGMDMYYFLENILLNFDSTWESFKESMESIFADIFTEQNLIISTNQNDKKILNFAKKLRKSNKTKMNFNIQAQYKNEAFITNSELLCNVKVIRFDSKIYTGQMAVLSGIINSTYLMNEVRIKGGAYGCHNVIDREGICYFYSYRDPNLKKTMDVYDGVAKYVNELVLTEEKLREYTIGAINKYDRLIHPYNRIESATKGYMSELTPGTIKREREKILLTNTKNFSNCANVFNSKESNICVFGSEKLILKTNITLERINYC